MRRISEGWLWKKADQYGQHKGTPCGWFSAPLRPENGWTSFNLKPSSLIAGRDILKLRLVVS